MRNNTSGPELWTWTGSYCFKGITQHELIEVRRAAGKRVGECELRLAQVYRADGQFAALVRLPSALCSICQRRTAHLIS